MAWWLHFKLGSWDSEDLPKKTTLDVDVAMDVAMDVAEYDAEYDAKDDAKDITRDIKITGRTTVFLGPEDPQVINSCGWSVLQELDSATWRCHL